jgi:hypothetical protein
MGRRRRDHQCGVWMKEEREWGRQIDRPERIKMPKRG